MGVPPVIILILMYVNGIFHSKPSSYGGTWKSPAPSRSSCTTRCAKLRASNAWPDSLSGDASKMVFGSMSTMLTCNKFKQLIKKLSNCFWTKCILWTILLVLCEPEFGNQVRQCPNGLVEGLDEMRIPGIKDCLKLQRFAVSRFHRFACASAENNRPMLSTALATRLVGSWRLAHRETMESIIWGDDETRYNQTDSTISAEHSAKTSVYCILLLHNLLHNLLHIVAIKHGLVLPPLIPIGSSAMQCISHPSPWLSRVAPAWGPQAHRAVRWSQMPH